MTSRATTLARRILTPALSVLLASVSISFGSSVGVTGTTFCVELDTAGGEMLGMGYRPNEETAWTSYNLRMFGRYKNPSNHDTTAHAPTIRSVRIGNHTLVKYEIRQNGLFWNFWFDLDDESHQLRTYRFVYGDTLSLSLNGVGIVFDESEYSTTAGTFSYSDVGGIHEGGYFDFQKESEGLRVMVSNMDNHTWTFSGSESILWYRDALTSWGTKIDYRRFVFVPYSVGDDLTEYEGYMKQHIFDHDLTNVELAGSWVVRSRNRNGALRDWFNAEGYQNGFIFGTGGWPVNRAGFWRDDWTTGALMRGLKATYDVTDDVFYLMRLIDISDYQIDRPSGRLKYQWGPNQAWQENYPMGRIEALVDIYELTGWEYYRDTATNSLNWFFTTESSMETYTDMCYSFEGMFRADALNGGAWRTQIEDWLSSIDDDTYDPAVELYDHLLDFDPTEKNYWSRGHGWLFETFPNIMDHYEKADKEELRAHFRAVATNLYAYQEGIWHKYVNEPNTFLEASGGTMISAGLAEAYLKGELDLPALDSAMEAISYITASNLVADGTIIGTDRKNISSNDPFPYTQEAYVRFARNVGVKEILYLQDRDTLYTTLNAGVLICDASGGTVMDTNGDSVAVDGRIIINGYNSVGTSAKTIHLLGVGTRQVTLYGFDANTRYVVRDSNIAEGTQTSTVATSDGNGRVAFSVDLQGQHIASVTEYALYIADIACNGGAITLFWDALPGTNYTVKAGSEPGTWNNNIPVGQTNAWLDPDSTTLPRRFYRVRED